MKVAALDASAAPQRPGFLAGEIADPVDRFVSMVVPVPPAGISNSARMTV